MPADSVPAAHDDVVRAAVLRLLLDRYPAWLTDEEVARAVGAADATGARQAVRDLDADGLVHRRSGMVLATRPAVVCAAMLGELSA